MYVIKGCAHVIDLDFMISVGEQVSMPNNGKKKNVFDGNFKIKWLKSSI